MTKKRHQHRHRPRIVGHGVIALTEDGLVGCLHPRDERCEVTGCTGLELEHAARHRPKVLYEATGHAHSGATSEAYRRNWARNFKPGEKN
jgi:hypothetical protein